MRPLFLLFLVATTSLATEQPNILFLIVDDLRPELGCYGVDGVKTPHIDKLAETALVFENAHCQQAVCMASRMSLLAGLRPTERGIWTNSDVRKQVQDIDLFPGHFRRHGYHSLGIGKINHNSREDPRCWSEPHQMPENAAYEYRTRTGRAIVEAMQRDAQAAGLPDPFRQIPEKIRRGKPWETLEVNDRALGDGQIADLAIEALKSRKDRDEPFFLGVGFLRPHLPFVAPKRYWDLYDSDDLPEPSPPHFPEGTDSIADNGSGELLRQYRGLPPNLPLDNATARNLVHGYYACVSYVDAQIGRILDALEQSKLTDDTIVVLTSDHGFHLGDGAMWCKATNFEWSTRVPLLVRDPNRKAHHGRRSGAIVELLDLYPTLCDLTGLEKPDHLQGISFAPLLDDPSRDHKSCAASQYYRGSSMGYSIRTADFRYTEWRDRETGQLGARELYDHRNHSREDRNLIEEEAFAEKAEALAEQLGVIFAD